MPIGYKSGGRAPGTPNKRTREAARILDELGCNPIRGMAEIAMSDSHPVELRARMFMELAHYVYPKRKAVDFHHVDEPPEADLEPGKKLMELMDKIRLPILPALNGTDGATNGPGVELTLGEPFSHG